MPLSITVKPSDTFKTVSTITDYDSVILVGGTYYGFKLTGTQYRLNG
ncbi:MAG: hypothetical protein Q4F54_05235 [Coriobacteriia bacterium]|nr:hypothetical protein [Coriobacteriia bacterium]